MRLKKIYHDIFKPDPSKINPFSGYQKYLDSLIFLRESLNFYFNYIYNNIDNLYLNNFTELIIETIDQRYDIVDSLLDLKQYEENFKEIFTMLLYIDKDILYTFSKIALSLDSYNYKTLILLICMLDMLEKIKKNIIDKDILILLTRETRIVYAGIQEIMTYGWYIGKEINIKNFIHFNNQKLLDKDFDIYKCVKEYVYFNKIDL